MSLIPLPFWDRLTFVGRLLITASLALMVAGVMMLYASALRDAEETRRSMQEELAWQLSNLPQLMSEHVVIGDYATLQQMLQRMVRRDTLSRLRFKDQKGATLESVSPPLPLRAPPWFHDWLGLVDLTASVPLEVGGRHYGELQVIMTSQSTSNRVWDHLLRHLSVLTLAISLDFLGIWLVLRTGLQPLRELGQGSRSIGHGDLSVRLPERGSPEMRTVIRAFNHMANQLEKRDAGFRTLTRAIEQSPVSVMISDAEGRLEYVNPRFLQVSGYSQQESLGHNPRFLQSGHTPPDIHREMWRTLLAGG
ncbi:MAG: HAMP domain-containing protein, partial [Magnetococcales bacterium]|nr:HAMP domain-containing protein [Magnetococcales bacterium]